ncbi:MAG: PAS domain-containing protein [Undibacterium sp.]|nr:PAS domain-containing protein [Undibacterium sp.]
MTNHEVTVPNCELQELHELLGALGENLWEWNLLTDEVFFSPGYQKLLGFGEGEFGHHIEEWIKRLHPDDAQRAMQATRTCLEGTSAAYQDEHRLLCRDGSWKWVRSRGAVVTKTADGRPARMAGLITDITRQHALSAQRSDSHTLLSNFSEHLPGIFFYQFQVFPDGRSCFPYASKAIVDIYGITPDTVSKDASALFALIHPDDIESLRSAVKASAASLQNWHQEYRIRTHQGEHWLLGDAHPQLLPDSSVLWHGFITDISAQKRTEEKLRSAEQQVHLVMKASHLGVYDFNIQTGEGTVSPEYAKMLGLAPNDFQDPKKFWNFFWNECVHPDDVVSLKQAYQLHFSARGTNDFRAEFRMRPASGEWRWIMSMGNVTEWDTDGRALRMLGLQIDITERKQAEQAAHHHEELLRKSGERYKQLANELEILISNTPMGVMFVSNGEIIRANKALADLCRFNDVKEMIGIKSTFLYQDEADYQAFATKVIPQLIADELVELEWRVKRIDGSTFLARIAGKALPSTQYVRGAVWMVEDITEQRSTLDALKHSEQRLKRLTNSSLIGIAQGSGAGQLSDVNQLFLQICGHSQRSLLTQTSIWDILLEGRDLDACRLAYTELLETGVTAPFEVMLKHADGHRVPVLIGLSYLENSYSEWAVFVLDISERHRINQLKSEFISVVSHELRTPLTSIRGSLGLLEAGIGGVLPEKALHLIKIAHGNSRRLVGLVNDILDMEKLASGNMQFKSERVDLVALLNDAIEANIAYAVSLNVRLQLFHHPDSAWVMADTDRLMQVMANLMSNAAKFSPKGDLVRLQIHACVEHGNACYKVEVSDRGPGIPGTFQARIFEPFSQADGTDTRQQGGTGLGLSITKTYLEKMHGEIGFVTQAGEGTTFWFVLPAIK